jgi:hypothetical protein
MTLNKKGNSNCLYLKEVSETTLAMGSLQKLPLILPIAKGNFCKLPISWAVLQGALFSPF